MQLRPILPPMPSIPIRPPHLDIDKPVELPRVPVPCPPAISKAKKIAWVESQIKKDQQEAVNPSYRAPFRSKEDASKRLLRYHVFDEPSISLSEWTQSEDEFEKKSTTLLSKYHSMLSKYHILLLQESTRLCSSSEEVMLSRHWEADERANLVREKEEYARDSLRFTALQETKVRTEEEEAELHTLQERMVPDLPPIPSSWEEKYEEVIGRPYQFMCKVKNEDVKPPVSTRKPQELTPVLEMEIKKEPDLAVEMPVLEDERLFRYNESKLSARSRNSSQASLDSFRSRNDSGASKKELRINLTNVMNYPSLKKELLESCSISSQPQSTDFSSPEHSQGASFVGLKFNRTTSGRWSASLKRDLEDDESTQDSMDTSDWKKSRVSPTFGSDSDDDFTLADVGGEAAVRSMLEQDDDGDPCPSTSTSGFYSQSNLLTRGGTPILNQADTPLSRCTPGSEVADTDSVQNAINSILELHDRGGVETPDDLNNLAGLLDSMEDEESADPNLDAAVRSIQGLL